MKGAAGLFVVVVAAVECYKFKLLNVTECRVPDPPIVKNVREKWVGTVESYTENDRTLVRGNVTFLRDLPFYVYFKVTQRRKRYNNIVKFKGITCRNVIAKMLMEFTNIKYDANECKALKGNYVFKDLDIGKIEQVVTYIPTQKVGPKTWYFAFYHKEGSYICFDISVLYER